MCTNSGIDNSQHKKMRAEKIKLQAEMIELNNLIGKIKKTHWKASATVAEDKINEAHDEIQKTSRQ